MNGIELLALAVSLTGSMPANEVSDLIDETIIHDRQMETIDEETSQALDNLRRVEGVLSFADAA